MRHVRINSRAEASDLGLTLGLEQSEMQANRMYGPMFSGDIDDGVKKTAFFKSIGGDVDVLDELKGVFAEDRVTVMACAVDRIFSISHVWPDLMGQVVELGLVRPIRNAFAVTFVFAEDFLKQDEFGLDGANGVSDS